MILLVLARRPIELVLQGARGACPKQSMYLLSSLGNCIFNTLETWLGTSVTEHLYPWRLEEVEYGDSVNSLNDHGEFDQMWMSWRLSMIWLRMNDRGEFDPMNDRDGCDCKR